MQMTIHLFFLLFEILIGNGEFKLKTVSVLLENYIKEAALQKQLVTHVEELSLQQKNN